LRRILVPLELRHKPLFDAQEMISAEGRESNQEWRTKPTIIPPVRPVPTAYSLMKFLSLKRVCRSWKKLFDQIQSELPEALQIRGSVRSPEENLLVISSSASGSHGNEAFGEWFNSADYRNILWVFRMEEPAGNLIFFGASWEHQRPFQYSHDWGAYGWSHLYFFNENGHNNGGFEFKSLVQGAIVTLCLDVENNYLVLHIGENFKSKIKIPKKPRWRLCLNLYASTRIRLLKCFQFDQSSIPT